MGENVVVTGADLPIGRRVVTAALGEPGVDRVIAVGAQLDSRSFAVPSGGAELVIAPFALDDSRVAPLVAGATRLFVVGPRSGLDIDGTGGAHIDVIATRAFLASLTRVGAVRTTVVLSSGLVYGARADNPIPLTEYAPVRPNSAIDAAVERAELERLCRTWSRARGATCAMVRPCIVVGPENEKWLARSSWATAGLQLSGAVAPVQFVHLDDLTTALLVVCRSRVDGPINVAPDGWLSVDEVRALKGPTARVRISKPFAYVLARIGKYFGVAPADPDALLASSGPWVVDNERIRSLGWEPTFTNEEAYVDADRGGLWSRLTPRHRQQMALGAVGAVVLTSALGAFLLIRQRLRSDR
ncbi:MAG: NAD-dependent epimerase/dehydratase family protein [Actinomycetes bacterium]